MSNVKIRLLTSVAGGDYTYAAGDEVDAPEERAKDLVRAGHAEMVGQAEKRERATKPQHEKR